MWKYSCKEEKVLNLYQITGQVNLIFVAFQSELRHYIVYITFSDKQKAFKTVDICEQ